MLIALDPSKPYEFVPASERGAEYPSTFMLRPMTTLDRVELSSIGAGEDRPGSQAGALAVAMVRRCLVGWRNVTDSAGAPVALERDWSGVTRECLSRLPAAIIMEIANDLFSRESIAAAEVGKS